MDGSGNVYVTGHSIGSGTFGDYATIKYNSAGVQQWIQRYNGPGNSFERAYSIAVDGSGNVYVTGQSLGNGTNYDYATIKYNTSGVQQWVQRNNGPGNSGDGAYSITVDGSWDIYVTGQSSGSGTDYDYATIKYSQPVGIKPISSKIPKEFSLSQNYPNPFNPKTTVSYDLPISNFVRITIYDVLGNEVITLVNEKQSASGGAGTYSVEWDASNFPSGIYFYRITVGDPSTSSGQVYSDTKKMIFLK